MHTEFREAVLPGEIRALQAFDRRVFPPADRFPADYWKQLQSFWLLVDRVKAGCCAFQPHTDFERETQVRGCLYIASTAILPRFQGRGLGRLMKAWQIAFAERHGFERIVTNTRKRNRAMIRLNESFGFEVIRVTPRYYSDPTDATVVMQLRLERKR